jgi:DNA-binding beta-propeller fold protein YncE
MPFSFRQILLAIIAANLMAICGCLTDSNSDQQGILVWGKRGLADGQFQTPRAIAINDKDELYIVDKTARIQVFDRDGNFLRGWRTPEIKNGKPCGLGFDNNGNLLVADTHYYRVLTYTPSGKLLNEKTIGGTLGHGDGQFEFLTDVAMDSKGNYYVGEYGDFDRIQKFDSTGNYVSQFGGHGSGAGQFLRPQGITIDKHDHLWVADACNHRIHVFDVSTDTIKLIQTWGDSGSGKGQIRFPYGVFLDDEGLVYVCEWGNNRIQKFTPDGKSIAVWGGPGKEVGQMHQPWGAVMDSKGFIHILDSYNNRVQRFKFQVP